MSVDELFDSFDLEGLREFRKGVERLRDTAIHAAGSANGEIEAAGRLAGYNKVLSEIIKRITEKEGL